MQASHEYEDLFVVFLGKGQTLALGSRDKIL